MVTPRRSFIYFGPLLNFPKDHRMQAPNYAFPSRMDDTHIVEPMSEITCTFDHLST
jgi:hypothetical protein